LFGKLLDVLNRIDARLQAIETSVAAAAKTNSVALVQNVALKELADYFDEFFKERRTFLDPKEHDNLLVDDETFSR